jgi:DNA-directed RNA polymerase subunit RPC12/RpoP
MYNRRQVSIHYLKCLGCGKSFPIPRHPCKQRPKNHIKDIFCPYCGKIEKFIENIDSSKLDYNTRERLERVR